MRRVVAVVAGLESDALALAMLEDVVDLVTAMQEVDAALLVREGAPPEARAVVWPGTPVTDVPAQATIAELVAAVDADEVAVVCPQVPDLPALLLGKLHSALTSTEVAVCPDETGGVIAVATRLPVPAWLTETGTTLDDYDALAQLRSAAPRRALHVGPGWHRIRTTEDLDRLDPGLEGWEATRAFLGR